MQLWQEVPYIKVKVADLTFRDYTPSACDADTSTCTLFIDAAHKGHGSEWARRLQKDDTVQYLKIDTTRQLPDATALVVGLGDESSIGHLLALQQLVLPVSRFAGAVAIADEQQRTLFNTYFKSPVEPIAKHHADAGQSLMRWVTETGFLRNAYRFLFNRQPFNGKQASQCIEGAGVFIKSDRGEGILVINVARLIVALGNAALLGTISYPVKPSRYRRLEKVRGGQSKTVKLPY